MTTTAGQVAVKLNLDKKQFEQGMNEAKKSVDLLSAAFSSIAALGVGATLLNIGKSALKASADFEQANVSFGVMLGNVEKASELVGKVAKMANVTPFQTKDLLDASRTMLQFGINAESIMPNLQMLGDVAGGNAEKMQALTLAFSKISSTGKMTSRELMQMVYSGFNPLQVISQKTGKSMAALREEMEDGKITFSVVSDAFKTATSEGGMFYQMMEKQSKTLTGSISTLQDKYILMIRSISDMALPIIKQQVEETIRLVDKTNEAIASFKEWASVNNTIVNATTNTALALAATVTGSVALINVVNKIQAAYTASVEAVTAAQAAQEAYTYAQQVAAAAEVGVYNAKLANMAAIQAEDAELIKLTASDLAEAEAEHANAVATVEATAAKAANTKASAAQLLMMGNLTGAIKTATVSVRAFTVALLDNPLTWVTVAIGAVSAAIFSYKNNVEKTTAAINDFNNAQNKSIDETENAIKTLQELNKVQKKTDKQYRQYSEAIETLTSKYPQFASEIQNEIQLQGKLSETLARKIALMETEMQLKKLDAEIEKNEKISKGFHPISNIKYSISLGKMDEYKLANDNIDKLMKEREEVLQRYEAKVNTLMSIGENEDVKQSSSGSEETKEKKTAKQLAAEEKARQKEALDLKIAQLEIEKYETQKTADEIYQINLQEAEVRIAAAKAGTSEYAQALAAKLQLEREYETAQKALQSQKVVDDLAYAKQDLDNQLAMLEIAYDSHKISKKQMLQTEIDIINQKKALEEEALKEQLKLVEGNAAEELKIKRAALKTMEDYNIEANRKAVELANYQKEAMTGAFDDISSGWGSTVADLLNGEASFTEAFNSLIDTVLTSFGDMCGNLVTQWLNDHVTMQSITETFSSVKLMWDNLLGISTEKRIAENELLAISEAETAGVTAASSATTSAAMSGLGTAIEFVTSPIMKLAGAMATLAVSSGAVALSMPVIAISTTVTALSAALAALSIGMLNTTMLMTSGVATMFAPVSMMLSAELEVVAAAANTAAVAVGKLAVALAAASAASIPVVGWALAPAAATATGAGILAGQMLASSAVQFRESGGSVKKGQAYIVGEKRPELFIPDRDGRIEPNLNSLNSDSNGSTQNTYQTSVTIQAIDTKDFKQRIGDLTSYIHGNLQSGIKKRQLASLGGK